MVVIIREKTEMPDGSFVDGKRYISSIEPITGDLRRKAIENDRIIHDSVKEMERSLKESGLIKLMGKPDVIKLRYEIGKHLQFIDQLNLSPEAMKYVWRAIYDHTEYLYDHTQPMPIRLQERPSTSYLHYSYLVARHFEWKFVKSAGNWTVWVEFMDSIVIREDSRIIEWIKTLQSKAPRTGEFMRELNKAIRRKFKNIDTLSLQDSELNTILNSITDDVLSKIAALSN